MDRHLNLAIEGRTSSNRLGHVARQTSACVLACDFGDVSAEWTVLDEGAGLLDTRFRATVVAEGSERARFLHGQVTNDISGMAAGAVCAV